MNVLPKDIRDIFYNMSVGFDANWLYTSPTQTTNYPPYNLTEDKEDNSYKIEMAVAGFSKDEIEIFEEEGRHTIEGNIKDNEDAKHLTVRHYVGLAQRGFTRNFNIAPNIKIAKVTLENGILSLSFLKDVNKSKKQIKIS